MKTPILTLCLLLGAAIAFAQTADRNQYPSAESPKPLQLPEVQRFKMDNGLPVYLVEQHELPLVQFSLVSQAGSIYDLPGQFGLA